MNLLTRIFLISSLLLLYSFSYSQSQFFDIGGPKFLNVQDELPEDLTSQRSLVIVSMDYQRKSGFQVRGDWKKLALNSHRFFRQIGVDAIGYVYIDDLNAGPEVKNSFLDLMRTRKVTNIVLLNQSGEVGNQEYSIMVTPFSEKENGYIASGQNAWYQTHTDLERLMINLGRQVLRQEMTRSNLLIPEVPEYISDLKVVSGTRYENFPSRIQNNKMAVVAFQKVIPKNTLTADAQAEVDYYNSKVDQKNALLVEILKQYPFKYELVDDADNKKLYDKGFQYVLLPLSSTGSYIKQVLNYPKTANETLQISTTYKPNGGAELKTIPANANMTKFYIKQTIVHDIHVGDEWDADVSWELALNNFISNLRKAFKKN